MAERLGLGREKLNMLGDLRTCQKMEKKHPEVIIHKENRTAATHSSSTIPVSQSEVSCVCRALGSKPERSFPGPRRAIGHPMVTLKRQLAVSVSRCHPCQTLSQYFLQLCQPQWKCLYSEPQGLLPALPPSRHLGSGALGCFQQKSCR